MMIEATTPPPPSQATITNVTPKTTVTFLNPEDQETITSQFHKDGFVCLSHLVPPESLQEWIQFSDTYVARCFQTLYDHGYTDFPTHYCHSRNAYAIQCGVKHGFRQVVMRSPGRYEFSLLDCPDRPSLEMITCTRLSTIIPSLLDVNLLTDLQLCHVSLVVATPGAPEQAWHADGGHVYLHHHAPCHVLNVFLPLRDVPLQLGPTEVRPGTHYHTRKLAPMMLAAKANRTLRPPVTPELILGDAMVFDYRLLHRGKANVSLAENRPILVLSFSKSWYKDVCNFPKRSMYDRNIKATAPTPADDEILNEN